MEKNGFIKLQFSHLKILSLFLIKKASKKGKESLNLKVSGRVLEKTSQALPLICEAMLSRSGPNLPLVPP